MCSDHRGKLKNFCSHEQEECLSYCQQWTHTYDLTHTTVRMGVFGLDGGGCSWTDRHPYFTGTPAGRGGRRTNLCTRGLSGYNTHSFLQSKNSVLVFTVIWCFYKAPPPPVRSHHRVSLHEMARRWSCSSWDGSWGGDVSFTGQSVLDRPPKKL